MGLIAIIGISSGMVVVSASTMIIGNAIEKYIKKRKEYNLYKDDSQLELFPEWKLKKPRFRDSYYEVINELTKGKKKSEQKIYKKSFE